MLNSSRCFRRRPIGPSLDPWMSIRNKSPIAAAFRTRCNGQKAIVSSPPPKKNPCFFWRVRKSLDATNLRHPAKVPTSNFLMSTSGHLRSSLLSCPQLVSAPRTPSISRTVSFLRLVRFPSPPNTKRQLTYTNHTPPQMHSHESVA